MCLHPPRKVGHWGGYHIYIYLHISISICMCVYIYIKCVDTRICMCIQVSVYPAGYPLKAPGPQGQAGPLRVPQVLGSRGVRALRETGLRSRSRVL